MSDNSQERRARAEARFEKMQNAAREGSKAKAQYEADAQAVREKTARLRALRLAKEESDRKLAGAEAAAKPRSARSRKAAKPAKPDAAGKKASLAAWLSSQRDQGRRS